MGILSALSTEPLQRLNGYKNVLALVVNVVAAAVFVLFARDEIDWLIVVLIGVEAFVGGVLGSTVSGRRLPPPVLRGVIVVIGLVADRQARYGVPLVGWLLVLGLGLAVLGGAVVQSTIGFGLAVVAAPFVVLLAPDLMPAALLLPALTLPVLQAVQARGAGRRLAAAGLGAGRRARCSRRWAWRWSPVLAAGHRRPRGVLILVTVALSVRAVDLRATPRNAAVAGAVSGISGTAAAIGGPFLALVLQHERPQRVRSTLAVFFVAGSLLGLGGLPLGGELTREQVVAGLVWVPFGLVGFAVAAPLRTRIDPDRFRRWASASACWPASPSSSARRWPSLTGCP